jgi:hypothetical protein
MDQGSKLMTVRWRSWIVVSALSVAPGCNGNFLVKMSPAIQGSGIATEETRPVDAFHALEAGNALQVTVVVTKDAKAGLKISGDDNLVPLVESDLRDGALILRIKDDSNIRTKLPLLAEVITGELDRVEASGASKVTVKGGSKVDRFTAEASGAARVFVEGLETPRAVASATGASHVALSGIAQSLEVDASGASQVKADELKVDDAKVSISGASGAALRACKSVGGDVSGASHLDLHGRPAKNTVSTSGASHVNEKQ